MLEMRTKRWHRCVVTLPRLDIHLKHFSGMSGYKRVENRWLVGEISVSFICVVNILCELLLYCNIILHIHIYYIIFLCVQNIDPNASAKESRL